MKKQQKTAFFCQNCGYESPKWVGKCPGCGEWNRFAEEPTKTTDSRVPPEYQLNEKPRAIDTVEADEKARLKTGLAEMDRVLGGGIVGGSAILVGGDPGIGKSTLLLQVLHRLASGGRKVLYVTGEESASQIKLRADRIGASSKDLYVLVEVALENILKYIKEVGPAVVVIDSIQTVYCSLLSSAPGSVGQVREASERLIILSKKTGIPVFLVGHVTKDGSIAGPKVLEHMVDTVLYFEGDSGHSYRIIRGIKNRFGPTNEIGVFEMRDRGLVEVSNPSEYFLTERPEGMAGSVVVAAIEGTRPILVEVQALVVSTSFGMPRRTAIGVDANRVSLLVAVLDKIGGLHLGNHDIFLNVAGGVKLSEPAADLGVVAAIASSFLDRPVDPKTVVFGEVGLTGEVRGINQMEVRIREAARMGFKRCVLPRTQLRGLDKAGAIELIRVGHLKELLGEIF
ncbi:MAG: DNA repair protein RadA [Syntrophaceae bacterium]